MPTTGAVRALVATPTRVFSGSDDTTVRVWDSESLRCLKTLEGHEDNVRVLAVSDRHLFSGSWDKTIRVWDLQTLSCVKVCGQVVVGVNRFDFGMIIMVVLVGA